ncbi:MAG: hypothetical protein Q9162_003768 [Coniocarpon cinnabarinum]
MDTTEARNGLKRKREDAEIPSKRKRKRSKHTKQETHNEILEGQQARTPQELGRNTSWEDRDDETTSKKRKQRRNRVKKGRDVRQDGDEKKRTETTQKHDALNSGSRESNTDDKHISASRDSLREGKATQNSSDDTPHQTSPRNHSRKKHSRLLEDKEEHSKSHKKHKSKRKADNEYINAQDTANASLSPSRNGHPFEHPLAVATVAPKRRKRHRSSGAGLHNSEPRIEDTGSVVHVSNPDTYSSTSAWKSSKPLAGRFLQSAAQFSIDESIGSLNSSLIERAIEPPDEIGVTSFTFCPNRKSSSQRVCLGLADGRMMIRELKSGTETLLDGAESRAVLALTCTGRLSAHVGPLLFFITNGVKHSEIHVRSHKSQDSAPRRILKRGLPLQSLKVTRSGRIVVATTPRQVLVGTLKKQVSETDRFLQDAEYLWHEIQCKEPPSCFDFQIREAGNADAEDAQHDEGVHEVKENDQLDIAYGGLSGCIYMHTNVLKSLRISERAKSTKPPLSPRQMHWHREAVGAVAFSPDSNYLISGGQETVLVLWQLDTGRKSFLPHLESPIRTLSISPSGSMYAVGTADNTIMVLSTAELMPIAHFASLQTPSTASMIDQRLILPTKETLKAFASGRAATSLTCIVNPSTPSQLLIAAPSHQSANTSVFPNTPPSPYLQTYDFIRNLHVSRQALTRNNATSTNLSPEGSKLQEPTLLHIALTSNGQWLVTVDEWQPATEDLRDLADDRPDLEAEQMRQREVHLRIWRWNARDQNWMLNTIMPSPHQLQATEAGGVARVHTLQVNPTESAFATIGEDRMVRTWRPRTRTQDGRIVKGDRGESTAQTWWALQHVVPLEGAYRDEPLTALVLADAQLAWSDDGSLIAARIGFPQHLKHPRAITQNATRIQRESSLYLLDADTGRLRDAKNDHAISQHRDSGQKQGLAFVNRFLLDFSRRHLDIWDLPANRYAQSITFQQSEDSAPPVHFAINHATQKLAVAIPVPKKLDHAFGVDASSLPPHAHRDFTSRVHIYSIHPLYEGPQSPAEIPGEPQHSIDLPHLALALLSAGGDVAAPDSMDASNAGQGEDTNLMLKKGFVVVDSNANIRRIEPPLMSEALSKAMARQDTEAGAMEVDSETEERDTGILSSFNARRAETDRRANTDEEVEPLGRTEPRVVPGQKLAEAVGTGPVLATGDSQSTTGALPSVKVMFDRVVGLFWGRGDEEQRQ